jgi:hypothetical protein
VHAFIRDVLLPHRTRTAALRVAIRPMVAIGMRTAFFPGAVVTARRGS